MVRMMKDTGMSLCDETVTVYNSYVDPITRYKVYLPTVLHGVSWFGNLVVDVTTNGLISASKYYVRVPDYVDSSGKQYLTPKAFAKIPNDQMQFYWTLEEGDIIVKGEVDDIGDDAKPAKLEEKYDDVITIISVSDNRRVDNAPHWKVMGK